MAPVLLNPVPLIVIDSGIDNAVEPLISKAALLPLIVVTPVVDPNDVLFWICITPYVIEVAPA